MGAVEHSIRLGFQLQTEYPLLGDNYAGDEHNKIPGKTISELILDYNLAQKYPNISDKGLHEAVRYAIKGYDGHLGCIQHPAYKGLLSEEVYKKAVKAELARAALKSGLSALKRKDGIHARGAFKRTKDANKSHIDRGHMTYSYKQKRYIVKQLTKVRYWRKRGTDAVIKFTEITDEFNEHFSNGRTRNRTNVQLNRFVNDLKSGHTKLSKGLQSIFQQALELREQIKATHRTS